MPSVQELVTRCASFLGVPVTAAGIFATATDTITTAGGIVAGTSVTSLILDDPIAEGIGAAAGARAAREISAHAQGLTPVLLVAVTTDDVVLMDWNGNSASGVGPTKVLATFPRSTSSIEISKRGASYRVALSNQERSTKITGSVGLLSSGKDGKKAVIAALGA